MTNAGSALMGIGQAGGENRAATAARMAIASPLLEVSIEGAKGVLFNIVGGPDLSMNEINEAAQIISQAAEPDANIIFGTTIKEDMVDMVKISVIATGFDETRVKLREYAGVSGGQRPQPGISQSNFSQQSTYAQPQQQSYQSHQSSVSQTISSSQSQDDTDDKTEEPAEEEPDDLEIPAFLRQNR
jgi:cell division protein FtsZ